MIRTKRTEIAFIQNIFHDQSTIFYNLQTTSIYLLSECQALDNIFCKNRKKPLPVGSVKSNIGHSESTAGACSIAKVILAFETGLIAPNINFTKIRPGIPSLEDGRLSVCTDVTKLEGNLVGLNAFGFGGANGKFKCEMNPMRSIFNK